MDMGERLNFKQVARLTMVQIAEGVTAYEATAEGVTYRIEGAVIDPLSSGRRHFRAYRVVDDGRLHPAGHGGPHRSRASAIQQCEADLDDVLRDRKAASRARTSDEAVALACRECGAGPGESCRYPDGGMCTSRIPDRRAERNADPATTDDAQELMDRVIRRAQYLALQAVLDATRLSDRTAIGQIVNDAARALGTAEPYRVAP
jgi:hypothetical protein